MCQLYTVQTNLESVCQIREMMTTPEIYLYVLLWGEEFYFQAEGEKCVCVCVCVCVCPALVLRLVRKKEIKAKELSE